MQSQLVEERSLAGDKGPDYSLREQITNLQKEIESRDRKIKNLTRQLEEADQSQSTGTGGDRESRRELGSSGGAAGTGTGFARARQPDDDPLKRQV